MKGSIGPACQTADAERIEGAAVEAGQRDFENVARERIGVFTGRQPIGETQHGDTDECAADDPEDKRPA